MMRVQLRAAASRAAKRAATPTATSTSTSTSTTTARRLSSSAAAAAEPERYSFALRALHAAMAVTVVGGVGSALQAQAQPKTPEGDKKRGEMMWIHKSLGMATLGLLPLRMFVRASSAIPKPLPAPGWMHAVAAATHYGMYGFMAAMAVSGVGMAYYGAQRPIPFFWTSIPTSQLANPPQPLMAKGLYEWHAFIGKYGKFLIPAHVGGAFAHVAMRQAIFARMNPFVF